MRQSSDRWLKSGKQTGAISDMATAKLLARITESSLMEENIATRYVFLMMLAIANESGIVVGTEIAIARRLNMDLVLFQSSIASLTKADANSNSKMHEGRRILATEDPRGFLVVNYRKYQSEKEEPKSKQKPVERDLELLPIEPSAKPNSDKIPKSEAAIRIAGMKRRKLTTEWSDGEIKAFKKIGKIPEEDMLAMEAYYASDCEYLRRDLLTLLNHWQGEVDRAHEYVTKSRKPQHRALVASVDPDGWREFLAAHNQPYAPFQHAKSHLKDRFRNGGN